MPNPKPLQRAVAVVSLILATAGPALAQPTTGVDPRGRWITASGNLEVEIAPCGDALCGTVTQVYANRSMAGDGEMQPSDGRPALGMKILTGLVRSDGGDAGTPPSEWKGEIYNRENGKTYTCTIRLDTAAGGELVVRPYIVLPLFGKTQRWQRAR